MKKILILIISIGLIACEKDENTTEKLTDLDGNTYKAVTIGNQTWMTENLKTTHYPDGTEIPEITECEDWQSLGANAEAISFYENDSEKQYGGYYTYAAAVKACPEGWHLPTKNEWDELEIYLYNNGFNGAEGTALKANSGWYDNGNGTDDFGFLALPGGRRYRNMISSDCIGQSYDVGEVGYWWSSTEYDNNFIYYRWLSYSLEEFKESTDVKKSGLSVRYVKD
ncbi:MAG: hypothetical protein KAS71_02750 [Bacteroidales bacterium]|nr:hypothetical protein [Bacteroidales bacterium]